MAYTPINWQTGDTITAEKMNKMDNGWGVQSSQLFSETVTTTIDSEYPEDPAWGDLSYSQFIDADTLVVTFNGDEYVCSKMDAGGSNAYGGLGADGPDFSDIPFAILSGPRSNSIATENGGTYTISASAEAVETSTAFGKARGYWTETVPKEIFSEEVQTSDSGSGFASGQTSYAFTEEPPLSAVVTFDGTEYPCTRDLNYGYGEATSSGPDFTNFPFYIRCVSDGNTLYTATAGTYNVSLLTEVAESSVSGEFAEAVNSCVDVPTASVLIIGLEEGTIANKTWQEISDAFYAGTACTVKRYGPVLGVWYGTGNRYYMATGSTMGGNNDTFNPAIWRTAGESPDLKPQFYKYNSQMP